MDQDKAAFFDVESETTPGKTYTVRWLADGTFRCSCPYFVWREGKSLRKGEVLMCKHIKEVITNRLTKK